MRARTSVSLNPFTEPGYCQPLSVARHLRAQKGVRRVASESALCGTPERIRIRRRADDGDTRDTSPPQRHRRHERPSIPGMGEYRARLHSALVLEEALIRHPRLRVYVMHAGWPMLDDMLALMWAYPRVHVDTGILCFALPRKEFHRYFRRIVEAGFGKRIMFGSDQMNWPGAIENCIDAIDSANFMSREQKRDVLYNNAARFLRLGEEEIARHHPAASSTRHSVICASSRSEPAGSFWADEFAVRRALLPRQSRVCDGRLLGHRRYRCRQWMFQCCRSKHIASRDWHRCRDREVKLKCP